MAVFSGFIMGILGIALYIEIVFSEFFSTFELKVIEEAAFLCIFNLPKA